MRVTIDIPNDLLRRAREAAAARGISLRSLVTEALAEKLRSPVPSEKPWMKHLGKLRNLRRETARINRIIEDAFEQIEPEDRR